MFPPPGPGFPPPPGFGGYPPFLTPPGFGGPPGFGPPPGFGGYPPPGFTPPGFAPPPGPMTPMGPMAPFPAQPGPGAQPGAGPPPLTIQQGQCFAFALPQGWQVAEEGQFAVTCVRADRCAITLMVGNAGLPLGTPPAQYAFDTLARMQLQQLRFGPPRPAAPALGCAQAQEHEVDYQVNGDACHGVAKVSVTPSYDGCTMVLTWAATRAAEWPAHAGWLPRVAEQVQVTSGAAFGARGVMQQNLSHSIALGQQLQQHRAWSAQMQADVQRQRDAVAARQQLGLQEVLSGQTRYDDPYTGRTLDLPSANAVYWINPVTGQIVGDASPSFDPRTPQDANWQPMQRAAPPPR